MSESELHNSLVPCIKHIAVDYTDTSLGTLYFTILCCTALGSVYFLTDVALLSPIDTK